MNNIISISERNARIQDEAARRLIKEHMINCLKSLQEALILQLRYKIFDVPCLKIVEEALYNFRSEKL